MTSPRNYSRWNTVGDDDDDDESPRAAPPAPAPADAASGALGALGASQRALGAFGVRVLSATFGYGCPDYTSGTPAEVTAASLARAACDGAVACDVEVTNSQLGGDAYPNCPKGLDIKYDCRDTNAARGDIRTSATVRERYGSRTVRLRCD
mmetsp:Transcript_3456/g.12324  ORF Transcript_3456/g.12324 Transcript_3456/m.12324 type:complete len:151 (+) Transcript_3456:71-523(+)